MSYYDSKYLKNNFKLVLIILLITIRIISPTSTQEVMNGCTENISGEASYIDVEISKVHNTDLG